HATQAAAALGGHHNEIGPRCLRRSEYDLSCLALDEVVFHVEPIYAEFVNHRLKFGWRRRAVLIRWQVRSHDNQSCSTGASQTCRERERARSQRRPVERHQNTLEHGSWTPY